MNWYRGGGNMGISRTTNTTEVKMEPVYSQCMCGGYFVKDGNGLCKSCREDKDQVEKYNKYIEDKAKKERMNAYPWG